MNVVEWFDDDASNPAPTNKLINDSTNREINFEILYN